MADLDDGIVEKFSDDLDELVLDTGNTTKLSGAAE